MLKKIITSKIPIFAGLIMISAGIIVLIGWQFDIGIFKSPLLETVTMKANTAVCFIFAGLILVLFNYTNKFLKLTIYFLAIVILITGLLTLCEYIFGWSAGIDELFYRDTNLTATTNPGRMAPNTALNFLILGTALLVLAYKNYRSNLVVEFSIVFSFTVSVIGLLGYITGLVDLAGPVDYTRMAIHTSVLFILICAGMFFIVYERQNTMITIEQKLFTSLTASGVLVIFISILSFLSIQSLHQARYRVEHTLQVKQQFNLILTNVLDMQSSSRGYIISNDEKNLASKIKAEKELPKLLNSLIILTSDDPKKQKAIFSLEKLIQERVYFANLLMDTRRTKGFETADSLFKTGRGLNLTDSIRVIVASFIEDEDLLLGFSNKSKTLQIEKTNKNVYLSLGAQFILLGVIFFTVNINLKKKKKTEEKLKDLNRQLIAANNELETFSYSVSHDLRAPLRHIAGFIEMIFQKDTENMDREVLEHLKVISSSALKMGILIDDLLNFSRTGKTEINKANVNTNILLKDVVELLKNEYAGRKVEWNIGELRIFTRIRI